MDTASPNLPSFTIHLSKFRALDKPVDVKIKHKNYEVIAERYDGYGQVTYLYIDQPSGELKIIVWQDNHEDSEPYIFNLYCSSPNH